MWREEYRLGIESIDKQHIELFSMVEELLEVIKKDKERTEKEKYANSIKFMKKYVVKHFYDEEKYQESIHYSGIKEHKAAHRDFTQKVLEYEERLKETDFSREMVKEFSGMLVTWLIYHVAGEDQKIIKKELEREKDLNNLLEPLRVSTLDVLEKMTGIKREEIEENKKNNMQIGDDILIKVGLVGNCNANITFGFSKRFAFELIKLMTFMEVQEIDELVCSALAEMANIISGNVTIALSRQGVDCDIQTPVIKIKKEDKKKEEINIAEISVNSKIGNFKVGIETKKE